MNKQFFLRRLVQILIGIILFFLFSTILLYVIAYILPPPELSIERNTILYDEQGDIFGEEKGVESRYWVSLENIPQHYIDAVIVSEDKHFFKHYGFDVPRIGAAIYANIKSFSLREGASTLTQQYARNLYLNHEKTWIRKIKEAFYTMRLETHYTKEEILEGYVNTVYFGHGAYGVEAASRYFFNKQVSHLTVAEAALLASIPKGPSIYSPLVNKHKAFQRQKHILQTLQREDKISKTTYEGSIREQITFETGDTLTRASTSPYFQDEVIKEAAELLQKDITDIRAGGYHIYTTLDIKKQSLLQQQIEKELTNNQDIQVGAIAMDPETGAIVALVGGRDYEESPFNRATQAERMAGSAFKPFLYYAALEKNFTPTTKLQSERTAFRVDGKVYEPKNFNNYYANEPITLAEAIAFSDNIYAVKTHLFLGMQELKQTGEAFGFTSLEEIPSLPLGTATVTVEQMTEAYSHLANGGKKVNGHTITKISDQHENVLYERKLSKDQVFNERSTFILTDLLTGMFDETLNSYMTVTGASIADQLTRSYAGKSGSTDFDSWMVGYSPSLVTAIWLGYDDHRKLQSPIDYTFAKQIWAQFMETSHLGTEQETFKAPPGIVQKSIDPESGHIATKNCPRQRKMYFKQGTEPRTVCSLHDVVPKEKDEQKKRGFLKRLFDFIFPE